MVAKAKVRYLRMSPRKVRQVINLIRGEDVTYGLATLRSLNRAATLPVEKLLRSAISNALRVSNLKEQDLFINRITVDEGPMLKRYKAQAMGRATMFRHRTSHIYVELERIYRR